MWREPEPDRDSETLHCPPRREAFLLDKVFSTFPPGPEGLSPRSSQREDELIRGTWGRKRNTLAEIVSELSCSTKKKSQETKNRGGRGKSRCLCIANSAFFLPLPVSHGVGKGVELYRCFPRQNPLTRNGPQLKKRRGGREETFGGSESEGRNQRTFCRSPDPSSMVTFN